MRAMAILGMMVLAMTFAQDAEARGRRGGSRGMSVGVGVGAGHASSARSEDSSVRKAAAAETTPVAPDPAFLRPILPVRVPVQEMAPTRSASAGCASGRFVGQGAGFCQIN